MKPEDVMRPEPGFTGDRKYKVSKDGELVAENMSLENAALLMWALHTKYPAPYSAVTIQIMG